MIKWALLNILIAFTTGIFAILSASKHIDVNLSPEERKKAYLIKSISIYVGIITCLICFFSKGDIGSEILVADEWTIVLALCLGGELLADYFVNKRCHPKEWEKKTPK